MHVTTFSSNICGNLSALAQEISRAQKSDVNEQTLGYRDALLAIHEMTLPLFEAIKDQAQKAGFEGVELFESWPKGHVQNFVFAVLDPKSSSVTDVILAKNKKFGFLQNGGGKTLAGEDPKSSALKEAQEEFGFKGTEEQMEYITLESEGGMAEFPWAKGVHIGFVTPEQAKALKLSDDMEKNEIVRMSIGEFLKATAEDKKPIDHGFDRKWIAMYLESYNRGEKPGFYSHREITDSDLEIAGRADEWMRRVQVNTKEVETLKKIVVNFTKQMKIDGVADGEWKTSSNRDAVKKSAQGVVDAIVARLLPAWTYESKGKKKDACQVKVQAAQGILVNGEPVPSFMTIPQVVARQEGLPLKKRKVSFEMVDFKQALGGHGFDIQTKLRSWDQAWHSGI